MVKGPGRGEPFSAGDEITPFQAIPQATHLLPLSLLHVQLGIHQWSNPLVNIALSLSNHLKASRANPGDLWDILDLNHNSKEGHQ